MKKLPIVVGILLVAAIAIAGPTVLGSMLGLHNYANSAAFPTAGATNEGGLAYDTTTNAVRMSDSTAWRELIWNTTPSRIGLGIAATATERLAVLDDIIVTSATTSKLLFESTGVGGRRWNWETGTAGVAIFADITAGIQRIFIDSSGFVGIGDEASAPLSTLHVIDSGSGTNFRTARFANKSNAAGSHVVHITGGQDTYSAANNFLSFARPDGTTIGTVAQNASTTVAYSTSSDARLKENVSTSSAGLDALMKIQVRDYNFKSDANKKKEQGFIAQELYVVYPQAVTVGGDDAKVQPWSVDYGRLTPLLVKAVQDQQAQIQALQTRLEKLEKLEKRAR